MGQSASVSVPETQNASGEASASRSTSFEVPVGCVSFFHNFRPIQSAFFFIRGTLANGFGEPKLAIPTDVTEHEKASSRCMTFFRADGTNHQWVRDQLKQFDNDLRKWPFGDKSVLQGNWFNTSLPDLEFSVELFHLSWADVEGMRVFASTSRSEEPFMAYHGTSLSNLSDIISEGFDVSKKVMDAGYIGRGVYFTTNVVYASHYINFRGVDRTTGFQLPKRGSTVYVIAALLKAGRTYRATNMALHGEPCKEGYDSHMAYVNAANEFKPCDKAEAAADEWVIFDRRRICPRYIIGIKRQR